MCPKINQYWTGLFVSYSVKTQLHETKVIFWLVRSVWFNKWTLLKIQHPITNSFNVFYYNKSLKQCPDLRPNDISFSCLRGNLSSALYYKNIMIINDIPNCGITLLPPKLRTVDHNWWLLNYQFQSYSL